jgi:hypothetical protein
MQQQQQQDDAFPFAALPDDALAQVLRWVPQQQRLSQCAIVCRAWRTAAAAATVDIQTVPASNLKAAQCFHTWLLRHGGSVKALTISRPGTSQRSQQIALPLKQLHGVTFLWATNADILNVESSTLPSTMQLRSNCFDRFLEENGRLTSHKPAADASSSSSSSANPLAALTGLETLGLSRSSVCGEPGGLGFLPVLGSSLKRLRLAYMSARYDSTLLMWLNLNVYLNMLYLGTRLQFDSLAVYEANVSVYGPRYTSRALQHGIFEDGSRHQCAWHINRSWLSACCSLLCSPACVCKPQQRYQQHT